jgi:type IV pilus assembly protein PilF
MRQLAQLAPIIRAGLLVRLLFITIAFHCPTAQAVSAADAVSPQVLLRTQTRLSLATAYFHAGLHQFAMEEVDQALVLMPQHAQALVLKALLYQQHNRIGLAQNYFSKALTANPVDPLILFQLGIFECQSGLFEKAILTFSLASAYAVGPISGQINWIWGQCLKQNNQLEAANLRMTEAFEQLPGLISEVLELVELKIQLGKLSEAEKILIYLNDSPSVSAQSVWVAYQLAERQNQAVKKNHWGKMLGLRYSNSVQWLAIQDRFTHE